MKLKEFSLNTEQQSSEPQIPAIQGTNNESYSCSYYVRLPLLILEPDCSQLQPYHYYTGYGIYL